MSNFPNAWGYHLILDFAGCPRERLVSKDNLQRWISELIDAIDMKAYGEPVIEHFATHSHDAAGFTLLQMIETSNICAHFAENLGQVYIDIFSCKAFDNEIAAEVCAKYFEPSHIERQALTRGAFPRLLEQAV
ncbi:MAG: S-adenosylmethionine decarboxylase family protein [Gammaproteobacteria bacterium]